MLNSMWRVLDQWSVSFAVMIMLPVSLYVCSCVRLYCFILCCYCCLFVCVSGQVWVYVCQAFLSAVCLCVCHCVCMCLSVCVLVCAFVCACLIDCLCNSTTGHSFGQRFSVKALWCKQSPFVLQGSISKPKLSIYWAWIIVEWQEQRTCCELFLYG